MSHAPSTRSILLTLSAAALAAVGCAGQGDSPDTTPRLGKLEIHQINVGWGSAVLVVGPDGTTVLLEAGNSAAGEEQVVPYLRRLGLLPDGGLDFTIAGHQALRPHRWAR